MAAAVFLTLSSASTAGASLTFPLQTSWTTALAAAPQFPPAFDSAFVYVSLRTNELVALSLEDGTVLWSVECPTSAAPAAGNGQIFVGSDGIIESRSQTDGAVRWRRPIAGRVTSLYLDTGWLFAATDKGPMVVLRAADGEVLWERDLGAGLQSAPALAGDRVYMSLKDGRLLLLSLQTGETGWSRQFPQPSNGILALADRLFLGSLDDWFYCLDTRDGSTKWRWRNGADVIGMPVIDTRRVYFVALDNVLRALSRSSGTMHWKRVLPMRPSTGPLLSGNTLIVAGQATELYAFNAADSSPAGSFALRGDQGEELQLAAPPHLTAEGLLIIITKGGRVHALAGTPPPSP